MAAEPSIASIGGRAARLLGEPGGWHVEAVFDHSFYIRSGDEFICIGGASIGNGPLNALLAHVSRPPQIEAGAPMNLDISTAKIWHAQPWPAAPANLPPNYFQHVIQFTLREAPPESFMHATFSAAEPQTALARRARAGATALKAGLASNDTAKFGEAASLLLGLGPGLTPSGDDVLSGALMMLFALGEETRALVLAQSISTRMCAATSPLSRAFLRAACNGESSAAAYQAILALMLGGKAAGVVSPLRSLGETSGFDMLAGIVMVGQNAGRNL